MSVNRHSEIFAERPHSRRIECKCGNLVSVIAAITINHSNADAFWHQVLECAHVHNEKVRTSSGTISDEYSDSTNH